MKFLAGLLKTLSILLLLGGTVACALIIVLFGIMEDEPELILVMSGAWLCVLFVFFGILGTGIALSQAAKLKARVNQLEQRLWNLTHAAPVAAPAAAPVTEGEQPAVPVPAAMPIDPVPAPAPQKKRKVWIPIVIAAVLVVAIGVTALFLLKDKQVSDIDPTDDALATIAPETEAPEEICPITVNGFFVDDSYEDKDGKPLKLVYMFYTMNADGTNLKIDSKYTKLYIDGNMYESDHFSDVAAACKYTRNYYYGSYIRDVYVGESMNVAATFYIPEGDLEFGKTVTLEDTQIPGVETLSFSTDEFQRFATPEDIAMAIDPEGYELTMYLWDEADSELTKEVRSHLNGYVWNFYVNNTAYELEFWANDNFSVTTAFGKQTGTYSVRNGYVFCTYPNTGYTVRIPYTLEDGEFKLEALKGFDVMENS